MYQTLHRGDKTESKTDQTSALVERTVPGGETGHEQGDKQTSKAILEAANAVKGISRGRRSEATPRGRAENPL